jgi:hypothetical protein
MAERTDDYQEEVLSDLLDLQAELRGETRIPADTSPDAAQASETVTVSEGGLEVSVTPSGAAAAERVAALNDRLARLERELDSVTRRIADVEEAPPKPAEIADADAPWRSFLDLQKIVADRLDGR